MSKQKFPDLSFERAAEGVVAGIDEAGCAPLAGPVVAAAVILPLWQRRPKELQGLNDSKQLTAEDRERLYEVITRIARFGVGISSVEEIDRLNIYQANMQAMRRAFAGLGVMPDTALIDGNRNPQLPCKVKTIIKGDTLSLSIAAASVVAKVTRDRLMKALAETHRGYGWETNMGYGTDEHYLGLLRLGSTAHHRRSFGPVLFFESDLFRTALRFRNVFSQEQLTSLQLIQLRQDLHAVFDLDNSHVGVLKAVRGNWSFRSIGYTSAGEMRHGEGPFSRWHNCSVPKACSNELMRIFLATT